LADAGAEQVDPRSRMIGLVLAGNVSQAIATAVELELPQALSGGPVAAGELAEHCGANERQLARLMRVLTAFGVFARGDDERYELTTIGATLLAEEGDGHSVAGLALFAGSGRLLEARGALTESVRTGASAFRCAHGTDLADAMQRDPELARLWERWAGYSAGVDAQADPVLRSYDFTRTRHVVDVGGRYGGLLAEILIAVPEATGTVFDLPDAEEGARAHLRARGVEARADVVAGSFFDSVPEGGDLYIVSNVLADWDDERAVELLRSCRAAMAPGSRLLVIEPMFPEPVLEAAGTSLFDLWMMVHSGGMRTVDEVGALLRTADLEVRAVIPTASSAATLIEAGPP
jgi:SAM-dependent methyltransferase